MHHHCFKHIFAFVQDLGIGCLVHICGLRKAGRKKKWILRFEVDETLFHTCPTKFSRHNLFPCAIFPSSLLSYQYFMLRSNLFLYLWSCPMIPFTFEKVEVRSGCLDAGHCWWLVSSGLWVELYSLWILLNVVAHELARIARILICNEWLGNAPSDLLPLLRKDVSLLTNE